MTPFTIKLPPGVLETGVLRIDWTSFSHILDCWRDGWHTLAWRRILPGWEPGKGFGAAIHAAMDVRFKGWGSGPYDALQPCQACDGGHWTENNLDVVKCPVCGGSGELKCMKAMEEALEESFTEQVKCENCDGQGGSGGYPCETCGGTGLSTRRVESHEGDHRTLGRAIEVMAEYDKLHPRESFEVLASELAGERELGMVEWELSFPVERIAEVQAMLPERWEPHFADEWYSDGGAIRVIHIPCRVIWQYRIDRLIRDRDTGRVAVMDCKHTAWGSVQLEQVRNEFKMSPQFKLYCLVASALGYGEVLEAAVDHIIVRKPLLRPTKDSKPRNEFNRIVLSWTAGQIEECRQGVLSTLGAWLTACGRWGQAPPMTGAPRNCHRYTHTCPYLQVCEQADEQSRISWLLGGNYTTNTWLAYEPPKEKATTT